jgi:hypothetical protein
MDIRKSTAMIGGAEIAVAAGDLPVRRPKSLRRGTGSPLRDGWHGAPAPIARTAAALEIYVWHSAQEGTVSLSFSVL